MGVEGKQDKPRALQVEPMVYWNPWFWDFASGRYSDTFTPFKIVGEASVTLFLHYGEPVSYAVADKTFSTPEDLFRC